MTEPRKTLADGTQIYPEHRNIITDGPRQGQQQGYVVLAEEERAKGFVRPVRRSYVHLKCGGTTTMGQTIAETYARTPSFYSGTFCCYCGGHFPAILHLTNRALYEVSPPQTCSSLKFL